MAAGSGVRSVIADCGFVQRLVAVVADSGPPLHSWVEEMADERHVEMRVALSAAVRFPGLPEHHSLS